MSSFQDIFKKYPGSELIHEDEFEIVFRTVDGQIKSVANVENFNPKFIKVGKDKYDHDQYVEKIKYDPTLKTFRSKNNNITHIQTIPKPPKDPLIEYYETNFPQDNYFMPINGKVTISPYHFYYNKQEVIWDHHEIYNSIDSLVSIYKPYIYYPTGKHTLYDPVYEHLQIIKQIKQYGIHITNVKSPNNLGLIYLDCPGNHSIIISYIDENKVYPYIGLDHPIRYYLPEYLNRFLLEEDVKYFIELQDRIDDVFFNLIYNTNTEFYKNIKYFHENLMYINNQGFHYDSIFKFYPELNILYSCPYNYKTLYEQATGRYDLVYRIIQFPNWNFFDNHNLEPNYSRPMLRICRRATKSNISAIDRFTWREAKGMITRKGELLINDLINMLIALDNEYFKSYDQSIINQMKQYVFNVDANLHFQEDEEYVIIDKSSIINCHNLLAFTFEEFIELVQKLQQLPYYYGNL